ncbi:MAG: hypothetical protein HFF08_10815 [Oscillospiraceae bacterium]|nr:hypothetical protein [Oscillospiraceae bacterium]
MERIPNYRSMLHALGSEMKIGSFRFRDLTERTFTNSEKQNSSRVCDTARFSKTAPCISYPTVNIPQEKLQQDIERYTEELKNDTEFVNSNYRFWNANSTCRKLVTSIIMADEGLQEEIAKSIWEGNKKANENRKENPERLLYVPPDYHDYNIKGMLMAGGADARDVLGQYSAVLVKRAQTTGLTDLERLVDSNAEQTERGKRGTFDQRLEPVKENIEKAFQETGMEFDTSKSYEFHLDTSKFHISVSGGTERENEIIEQVINRDHYTGRNLFQTLSALVGHRTDDLKYNPWMADKIQIQKDEMIAQYGIADVPAEYQERIKKLLPAFEWHRADQNLKQKFGFGIDQLSYNRTEGKLVGKTPEQTAAIEAAGHEFMKLSGYHIIGLLDRYQDTPVFSETLFTLENGKFHALY